MILVSRFFLRKRFLGVSLWPFIIVRHKELCKDDVFINHERIHLRQQVELLLLFFYLWYVIEFFMRWVQYRNRYLAYRNISFEREAYANEGNLDYLKNRGIWKFISFLRE